MAKREIEPEAVDEELVETGAPTVGERLRAAREEKKTEPRGHRGPDPNSAAPPRKHRNRRLGQSSGADLHRRLRQELCRRGRARPRPKSASSCARKWAASASPTVAGRGVRSRRSGADHAQMAGVRRDRRGHSADRDHELAQPPLARSARRAGRAAPAATAPAQPTAARRAAAPRQPARGAGSGRADRHGARPGSRSPTGARPCSRASLRPARPMPSRRPRSRRCSRPASPKRLQIKVGNAASRRPSARRARWRRTSASSRRT